MECFAQQDERSREETFYSDEERSCAPREWIWHDAAMRIRITMAMKGKIDGIDLARFQVGQLDDMGPSLAHYLMASGYAMPVVNEKPALVIPLEDDGVVELGSEQSNPRNDARPSTKPN